jgi:hypothetical protein
MKFFVLFTVVLSLFAACKGGSPTEPPKVNTVISSTFTAEARADAKATCPDGTTATASGYAKVTVSISSLTHPNQCGTQSGCDAEAKRLAETKAEADAKANAYAEVKCGPTTWTSTKTASATEYAAVQCPDGSMTSATATESATETATSTVSQADADAKAQVAAEAAARVKARAKAEAEARAKCPTTTTYTATGTCTRNATATRTCPNGSTVSGSGNETRQGSGSSTISQADAQAKADAAACASAQAAAQAEADAAAQAALASCQTTQPCTYTLVQSVTVPNAGGGRGLSVFVTGTNCPTWSAVSHTTWLQITSQATGNIGTGDVQYNVTPGTPGVAATGTMTIAGKLVTVTRTAN